ncbi:MAG: hypothetical protein F4X98_00220 [Gammaproteobacteria bacterium]|nr:hypothetical protein [Gammaproteobacteria bacterium]
MSQHPFGFAALGRLVLGGWLAFLPGAAQGADALAAVTASNASSERVDLARVDALYDETLLDSGNVDIAVESLGVLARDRNRPTAERVNHWLTVAHIHWRHGDQESALDATDTALELRATGDALLLKARILDATGDSARAAGFYERAVALTEDAAQRAFIRLRLTMAAATNRNVAALVDLANEQDQAFRNRAAIVLALLGHPDQAIELYDPNAGAGHPFRQHARIAHWALKSSHFDKAQEAAWTAYLNAPTRVDGLYALGLWAESHRKNDSLPQLLDDLETHDTNAEQIDPELIQLRIDVLVETENYDEAIRFYETGDNETVDVDARRRLIKLYQAAGRTDDMVAEYEQLMAREPHVVAWPASLASHYLNMAAPDKALDVWRSVAERNNDRVDVLVRAAESMVDMGFVDEAVTMVEGHGGSLEALLFLFNLRLGLGENDLALATLQRLESALPDDTTGIRDAADAYERINRPEEAIRILEELRDRQGEIGFDERVRLAWLYSVADRKEDAMSAWRQIWVSVDSAARRSLAESQFLLLATELNALGDLVVDLEERLALEQADRNEIGLLVRIYTEVGDTLSATEVIDEYSRQSDASEADRLRQLARVYRTLADYSAHDRVLRRLVSADPDNELEHVQNVVLNMLAFDLAEDSTARFEEIEDWLQRLRELDREGVSGEFEAGILSLGGFNDQAIESYRRALVIHPENSDNLLLMADLMKTAGRADEAVAILQYAAEHAADDAAFVVAIDGIINMIGARSFFEPLTPAMRRTFDWTRRVILERIAAHNDKFYLYQLLADIAQEVGDTESEFIALENSLSEAGVRRPAVLRELVTLATPDTGFGGFTTGVGDAARQIAHGRRLIALQQELPPEVYVNLGRVLLEDGAVQGAERAFDLIDDITGMIDVEKTKADLFHEAGYSDQALAAYTRALNVQRDNLALLTRTAMLREANGQDVVANGLYLHALTHLLRTQPSTRQSQRPGTEQSAAVLAGVVPATDTSVTRDYRTYFETLAQGFLITWPADQEVASNRVDVVRALFDTELTSVGAELDQRELAEFPRLERIAWFARRVAERASDAALREHLESSLDARSGGRPASTRDPDPAESLLRRQVAAARDSDDFEAAVRLVRLAGDEDEMVALLRDRIGAGNYRDGLGYARSLLDPVAFKRLTGALAPTLKDNKLSFVELMAEDPELLLDMEVDLGRDLVSPDELMALFDDPEVRALLDNPFTSTAGVWKYMKAKLTVDERLRHVALTASRMQKAEYLGPGLWLMFHDLLSVELSPLQGDTLVDAATEALSKTNLAGEFGIGEAVGLLLDDGIAPANRHLVYEMAEFIERRADLPVELAGSLQDILDGGDEESFGALLRWQRAGFRYFGGGRSGQDERYASIRKQILEAPPSNRGEPGAGVSPQVSDLDAETVRTVYEFEFPRYFGRLPVDDAVRRADALRRLIERYPDDDRYRRELVGAYLALHEWDSAEQALYDTYRQSPQDEFLRAALYFLLVYEGKYRAALGLATDGGPDLRNAPVVDALLEKLKGQRGLDPGSSHELFREIYQGELEPSFSYWSSDVDRGIEFLRQHATEPGDGEMSRRALRTVWRGAEAPNEEGRSRTPGFQTSLLLSVPLKVDPSRDSRFGYSPFAPEDDRLDVLLERQEPGEPMTLLEAVAQDAGSASEFGRYLQALPNDLRADLHVLYRLLVDAHEAAGTLDARADDLGRRLSSLSDHDFTIWLLLRHRQEKPVAARELIGLRDRLGHLETPTRVQVLALARLFAKAGAVADASEHYRLLAAMLVQHKEFSTARGAFIYEQNPPLIDIAGLLAEVARTLPAESARRTSRSIVVAARRADRHPAYDAYADALLLRALSDLYDPPQVLAQAGQLSTTSAGLSGPRERWQATKAAELIRVHARSGDVDRATALLRTFVVSEPNEPESAEGVVSIDSFELSRALRMLARAYGFPQAGDSPPSRATWLPELIQHRERLFPAKADHRWPGDTDWMTRAADALIGWLDDTEVDQESAMQAAFLVVLQLDTVGERELARDVLARIAGQVAARESKPGLHHLSRLAIRVGYALPRQLAAEILAGGTLEADQVVAVLRTQAQRLDNASILKLGRLADEGDKLAVMQFLAPLATAVGDGAYADNLEGRIALAVDARNRLVNVGATGSPGVAPPPETR